MISTPVSATINHLLARESWARAELVRHVGKIAHFDGGLATVRLKVAADGMVQAAPAGEAANVTIRVKMSDLPLIMQNRERAFSYVQLEGDADFANTISHLGQNLRWEAEDDLARLIGDIPATRVVAGMKAAMETAKSTQQKLAENVAEYLLDEKPVLVRPQAVADFSDEVSKLRDDVERLAKRLEKLNLNGR
ncbi:SCP2 domain-containing protein [Noviherbaspirillum sp. UKPF54]|uniref:ubiquinone biosynthesis accessory factor UbiJ n=1 Tax=Noviherbaspirillum sp. UKPF54 TaxID=2601898 RepID=UPI0011B15FDA|nr:sterol-binding protein [Noviherbaspirillum sp. UKPF54]QDZ29036.1 sterol-binding protein [Noviherbaspirillum sp. UKPF54]